jgi:hypothetical protein
MVSMNAATRGAVPGSPDRFPRFRVVWDAAEAEVGVWAASGDERDWIWRQRVSVIEEVANRAFDHARDEARGADLALDAVQVLRDPRMVVPLTIAAVVQVAAVHVGIAVPVAKLIGDAAGKLGQRLLAAESGGDRDPAVRYVDFSYDTGTRRTRPGDPAARSESRASRSDVTGELLGSRRRDGGTRAALTGPAPRNLSRDASQQTQRAALVDPDNARSIPPAPSRPTVRGTRSRSATPERKPPSRGGRGGPGDL